MKGAALLDLQESGGAGWSEGLVMPLWFSSDVPAFFEIRALKHKRCVFKRTQATDVNAHFFPRFIGALIGL